jgi:hypothetical protein
LLKRLLSTAGHLRTGLCADRSRPPVGKLYAKRKMHQVLFYLGVENLIRQLNFSDLLSVHIEYGYGRHTNTPENVLRLLRCF